MTDRDVELAPTSPPRQPGTALVTGASRGLGAHLARHLARAGHPVCVNYRTDRAGAQMVVDDIRAVGGTAVALAADVTDADAARGLVRQATDALGPVDVLVANATGPQPSRSLTELTWDDLIDQLLFTAKSPLVMSQAALPSFRAQRYGRVILIGSELADRNNVGQSAYIAAKRAMVGLARVWANELGQLGVTVNVVQPGWIPVERHRGDDTSEYLSRVPVGRMGRPDDVAAVVTFLAGGTAGFVTGQVITVNGGFSP